MPERDNLELSKVLELGKPPVRIEGTVTAIEHGNREQIEKTESRRDNGDEIDHIRDAFARGLRDHVSDAERSRQFLRTFHASNLAR